MPVKSKYTGKVYNTTIKTPTGVMAYDADTGRRFWLYTGEFTEVPPVKPDLLDTLKAEIAKLRALAADHQSKAADAAKKADALQTALDILTNPNPTPTPNPNPTPIPKPTP